ncbi:unnamed protein product, partial [Vitis vinifera]
MDLIIVGLNLFQRAQNIRNEMLVASATRHGADRHQECFRALSLWTMRRQPWSGSHQRPDQRWLELWLEGYRSLHAAVGFWA